jgi:thiamine-phosphate diphosphorylase
MNFPKLLVITDRQTMQPTWESAILSACQGGARWICVREKNASPRELLELMRRAIRIAEKFEARVFVNGRADIARAGHAEGLHLPEYEIGVEAARLTLGFHTPIGVSVHSLEGAQDAVREGANYLLFGPVFATASHPDTAPVGLEALAAIARSVPVPVFAVGGIDATNAARCLDAGATGVAVISGIWGSQNALSATREIRMALGEKDEPLHSHSTHTENTPPATSPLSAIMNKNGARQTTGR